MDVNLLTVFDEIFDFFTFSTKICGNGTESLVFSGEMGGKVEEIHNVLQCFVQIAGK